MAVRTGPRTQVPVVVKDMHVFRAVHASEHEVACGRGDKAHDLVTENADGGQRMNVARHDTLEMDSALVRVCLAGR